MKWKIEGLHQKWEKRQNWHKWFAWFPVELTPKGSGEWVWLETVERKWWGGGYAEDHPWEYRVPKNSFTSDE